VSGNILPRKAK